MTDATTPTAAAGMLTREEKARAGGVWSPPGFSWALFEFARNPYYLLVVIYLFPPYFARAVVGDAVQGQAAVSLALLIAGLICAFTAPFLGVMMDTGGRRKPLMAFFLAVMCGCAVSLWWAMPGSVDAQGVFQAPMAGLGVAGTIAILVAAFCAYTYTEVMHNSMLTLAGRPDVLSRISGAGLGLGNAAAVLCLIVYVIVVVSPAMFGHTNAELQTLAPRGLGPAMAAWLAIFVIPFFLFVPDGAPAGGSWTRAVGNLFKPSAAVSFFSYMGGLFRDFPQTMRFLIGRMIYADGLTSVMAIGGVYTSGVLGWSASELGLYAIWSSLCAAIGGFLGGMMDRWVGARRALIIELTVFVLMAMLILSITRDSIFFGLVPSRDVTGGALFHTLSDFTFLGFSGVLSMFLTACLASSRYMLVTLAPKHRISEFFGFFALAASCTVWMGPLLNYVVTTATQNQRLGMSTALVLVVIGLVIMLTVKHEGRPGDGQGA
jgi:UMF1 family MFS transporter